MLGAFLYSGMLCAADQLWKDLMQDNDDNDHEIAATQSAVITPSQPNFNYTFNLYNDAHDHKEVYDFLEKNIGSALSEQDCKNNKGNMLKKVKNMLHKGIPVTTQFGVIQNSFNRITVRTNEQKLVGFLSFFITNSFAGLIETCIIQREHVGACLRLIIKPILETIHKTPEVKSITVYIKDEKMKRYHENPLYQQFKAVGFVACAQNATEKQVGAVRLEHRIHIDEHVYLFTCF